MESMLKVNNQIDRLVNDISSPTQIQPNQEKLNQLTTLINSNNQFAKYLANCIKGKLSGRKHPKTQLYILELIEYTTVKGNRAMHNEYHQKQFLKIINTIFNQRDLPKNVKDKTLFLIQFWCYFFENQKDVLPNFEWFYKKIRSMKVEFPQQYQSKYENQMNKNSQVNSQQQLSQQQFQSNQSRQQMQSQHQIHQHQMEKQPSIDIPNYQHQQDSFDVSSLSQKGQKLYNDLQIVVSHVNNTNQQIDLKNIPGAQKGLQQLGQMLPKMQSLPNALQQSGEQFLFAYVNALVSDMYQTKNRYDLWSRGQQVPNFDCKSEYVKQQLVQQLKQSQQQQQQQQRSEEVVDKYAILDQNLPVQNTSNQNIQSQQNSSKNLDQDPFDQFDQNDQVQQQSNKNTQNSFQKSNEQINEPVQNMNSNDNLPNQQSAFDDFNDNQQQRNSSQNQQDMFDEFDEMNVQQQPQNNQTTAFDDFNDNNNTQQQANQGSHFDDFDNQNTNTQNNQQKDIFDDFDNQTPQQNQQTAFDEFNNNQNQGQKQNDAFDEFDQQNKVNQNQNLFGDFENQEQKNQNQNQQKQNMYFKEQPSSNDDFLF